MMVARELALIAWCESLDWIDDAGQDWHSEFDRREYGLLCNAEESAIYVLPVDKAKSTKIPKGRKGLKKAYRSFTGMDIDTALSLTVPNNRTELHKIGYLVRVVYISDKWTNELTRYGHDYKTEVILYADRPKLSAARVFGAMSTNGRRLVSERGLIA